MKLSLIYKKERKKLNLKDYKLYVGDEGDKSILESEKKSLIDVANPQLILDICITSIFYQTLLDFPKS